MGAKPRKYSSNGGTSQPLPGLHQPSANQHQKTHNVPVLERKLEQYDITLAFHFDVGVAYHFEQNAQRLLKDLHYDDTLEGRLFILFPKTVFKIGTSDFLNLGMSVFFLGSRGKELERMTNKSREPRFSDNLFVPRSYSFLDHPRKKDIHSLYLQCFQQRPFLKLSNKSYKFKIQKNNNNNNGYLT